MNEHGKWAFTGIGIPAEVFLHPELSMTDKILFGVLRSLSGTNRGCWATNAYLGKMLDLSPNWISTSISKLRKFRYIIVKFKLRADGLNERNIYVNTNYPNIYRELVEEGQKLITGEEFDLKEAARRGVIENKKGSNGKTKVYIDNDIDNIMSPKNISENQSTTQQFQNTDSSKTNQTFPSSKRMKVPPAPIDHKVVCREMAKKLAEKVSSKRIHPIPVSRYQGWAAPILKLITKDKIDISHIQEVMDWHLSHYGMECREFPYPPVVQCGESFYEKFQKIEDAMEREKKGENKSSFKRSNPEPEESTYDYNPYKYAPMYMPEDDD